MLHWFTKARPLIGGGVMLGVLQAVQHIDFNEIWFQFLLMWLSALAALLLGGDPTEALTSGSGSLFGGFML